MMTLPLQTGLVALSWLSLSHLSLPPSIMKVLSLRPAHKIKFFITAVADPALSLISYLSQAWAVNTIETLCFENYHVHQFDIPRNQHKIKKILNFSIQQYRIRVIHQPLKFFKVWHVGIQNVGNFMLNSNIWQPLLYSQPMKNYVKPRIWQKAIL